MILTLIRESLWTFPPLFKVLSFLVSAGDTLYIQVNCPYYIYAFYYGSGNNNNPSWIPYSSSVSQFFCLDRALATSNVIRLKKYFLLILLRVRRHVTASKFSLLVLGMDEWIWQCQELYPDQLRVVKRLKQTEEIYSPPVRVKD